ncbi:MAG: AraC family transcriptional regulator [Candidatus Limnocylindrales bacterium]
MTTTMTTTPDTMTATPETRPEPVAVDPLELVPRVLDLVRLSGAIFLKSDFRAPWSYSSPPAPQMAVALPELAGRSSSLVMLHVVASGSCWVSLDGGPRMQLAAGDVVVMPYGDANVWGSSEPAEAVSVTTLLPPPPWSTFPHIDHGGGGETTSMVCGYLVGDAVLFDPVLRALPPLFVVRPPQGAAANWMAASIEFALRATRTPTGGASWTDRRLPELLFTEVLRLYLENEDAQLTGWLAGLRDPLVGHALALMHADPAHDWTVTELASAVASSRTVLVDRFHELLGQPPIRYLTGWRMDLASGLLRTTNLGVTDIAERVGYESEAAFSRAFKRAFGKAPAHWRAEA